MFRILIADDESTIRNGLKKLIESFNLNIDIMWLAKDGEEALDLIKQYEPELILVDINMPFLNGLELIEAINNITPYSKTIIISGYDDFSYAKKAIELNVFSYLLKPIKREELKEVLIKAMNDYKERLIELNHLNKDIETFTCKQDDIYCKSVSYIKSNYLNNELTLQSAADDLFISPSYLSKIIKEQTHINFTEYVNKLRINTAKSLLIDTNHSIKEIALMTGFNSQHYFSRAFKKEVSLSPLQFRSKHTS